MKHTKLNGDKVPCKYFTILIIQQIVKYLIIIIYESNKKV